MQKTDRKLVFIGGYGRSGSTLLCAVLGGAENSVPLGELNRIFAHYITDRSCSCDRVLKDCEFWSSVIGEFKRRVPNISIEEAAEITSRIEGYSNWLLYRYRGTKLEAQYNLIWENMVHIILDITGKSILIDASKSSSVACNRAAAISKLIDTKQILLVRDLRAVTSSAFEIQRRRLERHGIKPMRARALRTLLSWITTNIYVHVISAIGLKKVDALISYESFTSNPVKAVTELASSLDLNVNPITETIGSGESFSAGHIFSGDGQRMKGEYQVRQIPAKWPEKLTKMQIALCAVAYPVARCYGYYKIFESKK